MTFLERLRRVYYGIEREEWASTNSTWVPVPGFENGYEMTRVGTVRCKRKRYKNKILPQKNYGGYPTVKLSLQGRESSEFIHRLVALAFVPNPEGKPYVNHINGIKTDIRPENFEWTTHQENVIHAYQTGLTSKKSQIKMVVDNCTGETFKSVKEAAQARSIPYSTCKNYLNGRRVNVTCLKYAA